MINWMQLVNNLRHDYKSLATVARELNSTEKHLNRLARGEVLEPRFNTGLKLLDFHLDKCGIEKHRKLMA
jgi:hypothetical protein